MKIIRSLEESGLIIKGFTKTIENVAKEVRSRFLGMVLVKLVPSLQRSMLVGKNIIRADKETNRIKQSL